MLHPDGAALLRSEVEVIEGWELDDDARAAALASAHGLAGGHAGTHDDIERGARLQVIASYGSGFELIDVEAASRAGILVVNAAGAQHTAVAEHAVGLMLALAKRIAWADRTLHATGRFMERGRFTGDGWPGWPTQLRGKTLGIVGFGFIGRDLAEKCRLGFGMDVLAYDPFFDPDEAARQHVELVDDLDRLLARSDFVSLHQPLTAATAGAFGRAELAAMKPTAFFLNLSRGATVDTDALVDALRAGTIAGAALDVFDPEPLPDGHPLYAFENVVLTPHIGGWVAESMAALATTTAREMLRALRGERPFRLVNPEAWSVRRRS
jgi:D-3-phosphoglycerate dehydrogenase